MSEEKDLELKEETPEQTNESDETMLQEEIVEPEWADDAVPEDGEPEEEAEKPKTRRERIAYSLYDLASIVGTAVIAIMVAFTFVFRFVGVVGPSMQPTLFEDDWLAVTAMPIHISNVTVAAVTAVSKGASRSLPKTPMNLL